MRGALTATVWILALASVTMAALIAAAFVFMATSLDPTDLIAAGTEPWTAAATAVLIFVGLAALTVLSLSLWHSDRFKIVGLLLALAAAGYVSWDCATVYTEYF